MADDTNTTPSQGRPEGAGRGQRPGGPGRDSGGFRIRLSDNEMQAARALQEAFGLRSTVAVLGFALRTLAQQLEEGQLDELVSRHRAQGGGRPPGPRGERGERRSERDRAPASRGPRVDPFARPARPAPEPAETEAAAEGEPEPQAPIAAEETTPQPAASDPGEGDAPLQDGEAVSEAAESSVAS